MVEEALAILMERFPRLGLLAPRWEPKPAVAESLPPFSLEKAEALYCRGLGDGSLYFQCKEQLKDKALIFLEEDPGIIASFLERPEAVEILSDPRVHLELFSRKKKEIEALAVRFPVQRVEVVALPSRQKGFAKLRLELLRKTALAFALQLDRRQGFQPFDNFVRNVGRLSASFYANGLKGAFQGVPAIVCGAGPSLQKSIEVLRSLENRALLIAGGSTLAALTSQGILPHFGMGIDPNLEEFRRMKNSFAFEVPILYSTRVHPGMFQTANGPFGYMRSGVGGALELWIEEELGLSDPLLGEHLSAESISVTSICVAWAQFLGCNPILLDGIDMAYTGNRRYAAGVVEGNETPLEAIDAEKAAADRILKRKDRMGKPIYTAVRWVMESASISHFAKKHPEVRFINTTEGGLGFRGIDYVPLAEAVKDFSEQKLRARVHEKIIASPMPAGAEEKIAAKMKELRGSLERVIHSLEILAGEKKGVAALAEFELPEECACFTLFYDVERVLEKDKPHFWRRWLALARKYEMVIRHGVVK